jgi:hypothetical protein
MIEDYQFLADFYVNEDYQFLADFYVVLLISLIWLCACEICDSVVGVIGDCQIVDRSLFDDLS